MQGGLFTLFLFGIMLFHTSSIFAIPSALYGGNRLAIQMAHSVQTRMHSAQQEANYFTFTGTHTFITYTTMDALVSYQGPQGKQTWSGSKLNVQDSPLGTLITVFFPGNPDVGLVSLSILLPPIDLMNSAPASFETLAIYVHHRGFILIPAARLMYNTIALHGTAQHIT